MTHSIGSGKGARILIADDIPANLNLLSDALEPAGYSILAAPSGEVALKIAKGMRPDLILLDVIMPGMDGYETCHQLKQDEATREIPVIFITAKDETQSVVEGFRAGGVDYITKPFQTDEVLIRLATHMKIHHLTQELRQKNQQLLEEISKRQQVEAALQSVDAQLSIISQQEAERWGLVGFVGVSSGFSKIVRGIRRMQEHLTNVLITGESGTGKELIARAIHYGSVLAKRPFVPVNCSAVPRELAESVFFGHVRGAFTGATTDHKGFFEQADKGTLFLDEIGDMPQALQAKLLRVLEDEMITPVGSTQSKKVEVRILAGTNAELQSDIEAGKFRQDLYYRLARFTIEVPPLRERKEDIPLLAEHFLERFAADMGMAKPKLSPTALQVLQNYDYPGNIRELRNFIERALIEGGGGEIGPEHLVFIRFRGHSSVPGGEIAGQPAPVSASEPTRSREMLLPEEQAILNYVKERGCINNTECRELLGVGMQRACYLLRKIHLTGLLHRESNGRWSQYRLPVMNR
ncbi:MAG TPA: sigma-54 dependent transcriptional regulator [Candidatus Limnocylindrales bacterium]|nr:sigma-54 dependent transcriptional regulator [Candidatus Limnocylindrales bacterium]